jgi:hypothetical protein
MKRLIVRFVGMMVRLGAIVIFSAATRAVIVLLALGLSDLQATDGQINFESNLGTGTNWYTGFDGKTTSGQYDLVRRSGLGRTDDRQRYSVCSEIPSSCPSPKLLSG